jgi:hypothetical protein
MHKVSAGWQSYGPAAVGRHSRHRAAASRRLSGLPGPRRCQPQLDSTASGHGGIPYGEQELIEQYGGRPRQMQQSVAWRREPSAASSGQQRTLSVELNGQLSDLAERWTLLCSTSHTSLIEDAPSPVPDFRITPGQN